MALSAAKAPQRGGKSTNRDLGRTSGVLRAYSFKEHGKSTVFSGKVRFFREKYDFFSTPKMAIWGQLGFKCQLGVIWGLDVRWVSVEYR